MDLHAQGAQRGFYTGDADPLDRIEQASNLRIEVWGRVWPASTRDPTGYCEGSVATGRSRFWHEPHEVSGGVRFFRVNVYVARQPPFRG